MRVQQETVTCSGTRGETISQGFGKLYKVKKDDKGGKPRKDGSLSGDKATRRSE
jgi:hypothetical protein